MCVMMLIEYKIGWTDPSQKTMLNVTGWALPKLVSQLGVALLL
jgi:hypothetical protein